MVSILQRLDISESLDTNHCWYRAAIPNMPKPAYISEDRA
jgi:hypothetical protein